MSYGKIHQFLLRSVASRGVIPVYEADCAVKNYAADTEEKIPDMVQLINTEIKPYQQIIKIVLDELTNEEVLVFLSLGNDEATKSQNKFSQLELEYFRLLIEEIITTDSRQITSMHALNTVGKMQGTFSKTDAQKLLSLWCQMYYLEKSEENYVLGIRTIHEYENYFRQNLPDHVEDCVLCKHIVFRGYNCPSCAKAVHTRCLNRYLENLEQWPCCKTNYSVSQLEQLNCHRLSPTQRLAEESTVYNTVVEQTQEDTMLDETENLTQTTTAGISQCVSRKRKRQRE